jgi:hypothetical protein
VIGGWRKLRNEELHGLYSSPNIIRTIKSRRMRWAGHVARTGRREIHIKFLLESLKGRDSLEHAGEDGRILLKCRLS